MVQSFERPCCTRNRICRHYELTPPVVPVRTSFCRGRSRDQNLFCQVAFPALLLKRKSVPSIHIRWRMTAIRLASATVARRKPRRCAIRHRKERGHRQIVGARRWRRERGDPRPPTWRLSPHWTAFGVLSGHRVGQPAIWKGEFRLAQRFRRRHDRPSETKRGIPAETCGRSVQTTSAAGDLIGAFRTCLIRRSAWRRGKVGRAGSP